MLSNYLIGCDRDLLKLSKIKLQIEILKPKTIMKIVRLQIPGNFLEQIGFGSLFDELEFVEILNAFQYDQKHFFALQRIRFKPKNFINVDKYIKKNFKPESFQLLEKNKNEILCIIDQSRSAGFFPIIDLGPWAFLFPIHVSKDLVLLNVISQNSYVDKLFKILSSFTDNYEIIGMSDLDNIRKFDEIVWRSAMPYPKFTKRQHEIAAYAAKHGFFKSPKEINAKQIATNFNITESAVNKHLRNINNLVMEYFFGKFE